MTWRLPDKYTAALLHMDGAAASTTFTDESGKIWTAVGNAQIDTAQSKFGGSSGLFDGNGDAVESADHADWNVGTGDYTIDMWVRFSALPAAGLSMFLGAQNAAALSQEYYIFNNAGTYRMTLNVDNGGSSFTIVQNITLSINTWYHLAWARNGTTFNFFQDGISIGTSIQANPIPDIAGVFQIGNRNSGATGMNGRIDAPRFSKGIARWTANFTPPIRPYQPAQTIAHMQ